VSVKSILILSASFAVAAAFAQTSLGTVGNVQGLATDTVGDQVTSTNPGEQIVDGERFVTSSSGSITLQFNNGCTLTLQPNQAVTIDSRMGCKELIAAVTPVGPPGLAIASGNAARGLISIAGLAAGGFALDRVFVKNPNLSGR
jgi:hypothetical protein